MFAVGFIGFSGAGKTTLVEQVLAILVARGVRVSAIKSSHHNTDVDRPGKDSYRYRTAGATEVMLVGPERWALMSETPENSLDLQSALSRMTKVDIVLVEGYKSDASIPRIAVCRRDYLSDKELNLDGVVAVATDDSNLVIPEGAQRLSINDAEGVADFILQLKAQSDHV